MSPAAFSVMMMLPASFFSVAADEFGRLTVRPTSFANTAVMMKKISRFKHEVEHRREVDAGLVGTMTRYATSHAHGKSPLVRRRSGPRAARSRVRALRRK